MKLKIQTKLPFLMSLFFILLHNSVYARGGGGGSSSGGGGGGFSGSGSYSGGSMGGSSGSGGWWGMFFNIAIVLIAISYALYKLYEVSQKRKQRIASANSNLIQAKTKDQSWDDKALQQRVEEVFYKFQADWSSYNLDLMKDYLTAEYFKRMVLELNVLKNENRQNLVEEPTILSSQIISVEDSDNDAKDSFTVEIRARANDKLVEEGNVLYVDSNSFCEYWTFKREADSWRLDLIKQETENEFSVEPKIKEFASNNNFYYDPDFGWLMMPDKGVLFKSTNFMTSDINNHVIGYFRDKIVEFYTYQQTTSDEGGSPVYTVAQAILPISYQDILVKKKGFLDFKPSGLKQYTLESNDFNRKFVVYATEQDKVNSFELLAPNFMEKIYALPFEINIEVVGSFLYLYTKSNKASYQDMLEVLCWAFDEMKM